MTRKSSSSSSWLQVASIALLLFISHTTTPCMASSTHVREVGRPASSSFSRSSLLRKQRQDFLLTFPRGGATKPQTAAVAVAPPPSSSSKKVKVKGDGTASIPSEVFNLVKIIVGSGVLGLSSGIAAFGDNPGALVPACALILVTGSFGAYSFNLIGRICSLTGSKSYKEAWTKSVGESSNWFPTVCVFMVTFFSSIGYSMILTDTLKLLLKSSGILVERSTVLLTTTVCLLLPLCLLKNLGSLAPFSLLGIVGMGYTCIAMAIRYFDQTYALPSSSSSSGAVTAGQFLETLSEGYQPQFGVKGASSIWSINSFIYLCMLSTAYMAHFNAPKLYVELYNNTLPRFQKMVYFSFGFSILIFCAMASFGFLTFGASAKGLILNNYSTKDTLMYLSRVAVAASVLFSYPLNFVGIRDSVLELGNIPLAKRTNTYLNMMTVGLLTIVTALALVITDLKFLLSMIGSTWGNILIYMIPSFMFIQLSKKLPETKDTVQVTAWFTAVVGVIMTVIGTSMTLTSS